MNIKKKRKKRLRQNEKKGYNKLFLFSLLLAGIVISVICYHYYSKWAEKQDDAAGQEYYIGPRKKVGDLILSDLRNLAEKSGNPTAMKVSNYLRDYHYYVAPMPDVNGNPYLFQEDKIINENFVKILIFFKTDDQISPGWKKVLDSDFEHGVIAQASLDTNRITSYSYDQYSRMTLAFTMLHEGYHIYSYKFEMPVISKTDNPKCDFEYPAHQLVVDVFESIGGDRLKNTLRANRHNIRKEVLDGPPFPPHDPNEYVKRITDVTYLFGSEVGFKDATFQSLLFEEATVFNYFDEKYKNNSPRVKKTYLCKDYSN